MPAFGTVQCRQLGLLRYSSVRYSSLRLYDSSVSGQHGRTVRFTALSGTVTTVRFTVRSVGTSVRMTVRYGQFTVVQPARTVYSFTVTACQSVYGRQFSQFVSDGTVRYGTVIHTKLSVKTVSGSDNTRRCHADGQTSQSRHQFRRSVYSQFASIWFGTAYTVLPISQPRLTAQSGSVKAYKTAQLTAHATVQLTTVYGATVQSVSSVQHGSLRFDSMTSSV